MALFPILIQVEESAVGRVLRLLNGYPGIAKMDLNLDGVPKKQGHKNGADAPNGNAKNHHVPRAVDVIVGELRSGQKNLSHLKAAYEAVGGKGSSLSSALYMMQKNGITESAGSGIHKLTDKALAELNAAEVPQLPPPNKPQTKSRDFVLQKIGEGKALIEFGKEGVALGYTERAIAG